MEQIIFYILVFCIGSLFGSFFTLAVYRIPLHEDITHKHSYCPNCMHKLSFWDMIPILSYIFLGGKCRYCKNKIRIRYLFLEILTGIIFLLFVISINLSFKTIEISKFAYIIAGLLYIAGLIIIAGIDKESRTIQKSVILYETIIISLYMVYLYIVENANMYRYGIYLVLLVILISIDNKYLKKKMKNPYVIEVLELSMIMAIFTYEIGYFITVLLTLFSIIIESTIKKVQKRSRIVKNESSSYYKNLPIGFYLVTLNIITMIGINWVACRW